MNYIIYMRSHFIKTISDSGEVYRSFRSYVKERYGVRVQKIPIALPLSCPNIDGKKARGGCIYCFRGSRPAHLSPSRDVHHQIERAITGYRERYGSSIKFFAYFQSYTNTYADPSTLKGIYDVIKEFPDIVGLDVGTRPDCVPEKVLDLLGSYVDEGYEVWLELGLQSANFETLKRINRAHGISDFVDAVLRAKKKGLMVCAHTIIGLPGEGPQDYEETARMLDSLGVDGVKIHPIYVMRNTPLAELYARGDFSPLSLEEYVSYTADFLEMIPEDVVVHRLTAEAKKPNLIGPDYCTYERKLEVIARIIEELKKRKSRQGATAGRRNLTVKGA